MSKSNYPGANISFSNGTFTGLVERVNELSHEMGYFVLTAANVDIANATNGAQTDDNAFLDGVFGAQTLVAFGSLRGGQNQQFSNSTDLHISSNVNVGNSTVGDILTVFGDVDLKANIVLGTNGTDVISMKAKVNTNIVPSADETYTLGTSAFRYNSVHANAMNANTWVQVVNNTSPILLLRTLANDASSSGVIQFRKDSSSPASDDSIGRTLYQAFNSNGSLTNFISLTGAIEDPTEGSESGTYNMAVIKDGINRSFISLNVGDNGGVQLKYSNTSSSTIRLTTTDYGVLVSGEMQSDSLDVNGIADISGAITGGSSAEFVGDVTVGGDLLVSGNVSLPSNVSLIVAEQTANTLTVYDNLISLGNTQLGDTSSDSIRFLGRPNTSIIPMADAAYDLGALTRQWRTAYLANVTAVNISANTISGLANVGTSNAHITNFLTVATANVTTNLNTFANVNIRDGNSLKIYEPAANGLGFVSFSTVDNLAASINYTLPPNDGSAGYFLQTDGSGVLTWEEVDTTLTIVGSDTSNTDISLNSEEITFTGSNGVVTTVDSNGNVNISIPQAIAASDSPTFDGITTTANSVFNSSIKLSDGARAMFGTSNDMTIFYSSITNTNYIDLKNGDLYIRDSTGAAVNRYIFGQDGNLIANGEITADSFAGNTSLYLTDNQTVSATLLLANTSASQHPQLKLRKDGNTSGGSILGAILYQGENSSSANKNYGNIRAYIQSASAGSEDAVIDFLLQAEGTERSMMSLNPSSSGAVVLNYANSTSTNQRLRTTANGIVTTGNTITTAHFVGNGHFITTMNASNMSTGTVPSARLSGTYSITSSNVTATLNNSENGTLYPTFIDGNSGTQQIENSTKLTFNPSTGALSATSFSGTLSTAMVTQVLQATYPVGSIYINAASATNPGTLLGFGTWTAIGAGRVLVGQDTGDSDFNTLGETGGSKDSVVVAHTHTFSDTTDADGAHSHEYYTGSGEATTPSGGPANASNPPTYQTLNTSSNGNHTHAFSGTTDSSGVSGTDQNLQPYIVVKMWQRTA